MVKKLYLMRHGQTLFNLQNKIQGWCDSPLTELGQYQAKVAGQYFKDHQITFDHAYCSTSYRYAVYAFKRVKRKFLWSIRR